MPRDVDDLLNGSDALCQVVVICGTLRIAARTLVPRPEGGIALSGRVRCHSPRLGIIEAEEAIVTLESDGRVKLDLSSWTSRRAEDRVTGNGARLVEFF